MCMIQIKNKINKYKGEDDQLIQNYRPISVLPFIFQKK